MRKGVKDICKLKKVIEEIKKIIDDYKLYYLNDIHNTLSNVINLMEEEENLKIYCVEKHTRNYIPGMGTDVFVNKYKFLSIEECEEFISKIQIGINEISKYRHENTIICVKILLHNEIIKTFNKTFNKTKHSDYEERINKDGKTYWYDRHKHISLYKNPHI
jgi:UDP-N-acetylglucosamine:LPS N-acetylglucosamine transferase